MGEDFAEIFFPVIAKAGFFFPVTFLHEFLWWTYLLCLTAYLYITCNTVTFYSLFLHNNTLHITNSTGFSRCIQHLQRGRVGINLEWKAFLASVIPLPQPIIRE